MLNRNILVVDDDEETKTINFGLYYEVFEVIKKNNLFNGHHLDYTIELFWENSIDNAIERLSENVVFDVILVDYDFSKSLDNRKGFELVEIVRKTINKKCKIVFYTMHHPHELDSLMFVDLINNDVFRFIPKDGDILDLKYKYDDGIYNKADQLVVEAIVDAISEEDQISNILERYISKYKVILKDIKVEIGGEGYTIDEIVSSIRLDRQPGNTFVKNLLEASITNYLNRIR